MLQNCQPHLPFPPPSWPPRALASPPCPEQLKGASNTHDRARWQAMMQSGLSPLYTSRALACTHTQLPLLVSSRNTVSPLSPVFITGAGTQEKCRRQEFMHAGRQMTRTRCHEVEHHLAAVQWGLEMQDTVSLPAPQAHA